MKSESVEQLIYQILLLRESKATFQNFVKALLKSFVLNKMNLLNNKTLEQKF